MDTATSIGIVFLKFLIVYFVWRSQSAARPEELKGQLPVIRVYRGTEAESYAQFDLDAALMADAGYLPTSQHSFERRPAAG